MKVLLMLIGLIPLADNEPVGGAWQFVKEQDGIKLFSRTSIHSKFNDIKVEADLVGTLPQMETILSDVDKYTDWAYATKTSVLIKKISASEFIYYSQIDVPWPATDRDYYARCKITMESGGHMLKVVSSSIKDYLPEKKNVIRVPLSVGYWEIKAIGYKRIHLEYVLELDPGGNVPAWLMNLFSTKGPLETFQNLKKKLLQLNE